MNTTNAISVSILYISNELTSLVPDLAQMDTSSSSGSISSMPDWVLRASWDTRQLYCSSQAINTRAVNKPSWRFTVPWAFSLLKTPT